MWPRVVSYSAGLGLVLILGLASPYLDSYLSRVSFFKTGFFEVRFATLAAIGTQQKLNLKAKEADVLPVYALGFLTNPIFIKREIEYLEINRENQPPTRNPKSRKSGGQNDEIDETINRLERIFMLSTFLKPFALCIAEVDQMKIYLRSMRYGVEKLVADLRILIFWPIKDPGKQTAAFIKFLDGVSALQEELYKRLVEKGRCEMPSVYNYIINGLKASAIADWKKSQHTYVILASLFLLNRNYDAAFRVLVERPAKYVNELENDYRFNLLTAQMFSYQEFDFSRSLPYLTKVLRRAEKERQVLEEGLRACRLADPCPKEETYSRLRDTAKFVQLIARNTFAYGVALDVAEGKETAKAEWSTARYYAGLLREHVENQRENFKGKKQDYLEIYSSYIDTYLVVELIAESEKEIPDFENFERIAKELADVEQFLAARIRGFADDDLAKSPEVPGIRASLRSVRAHKNAAKALIAAR